MTTETMKERDYFREAHRERVAMFGEGACIRCGLGGMHVTHDPPEYRATVPYHDSHPGLPFCEFLAPNTASAQSVSLDLAMRVSADEMSSWSPDRINRFFAGIAMAIDARRG